MFFDVHLYSCGLYENGKYYSAYLIREYGEDIHFHSGTTDKGWSRGKGIGPLLKATIDGIDECVSRGKKHIQIFHVYDGVAEWAKGKWKANKDYTQEYQDFFLGKNTGAGKISFQKIEKEDACYQQLYTECLSGVGVVKKYTEEKSFHLDPLPEKPEAVETSNVVCPRCASVGTTQYMEKTSKHALGCSLCHHSVPNYEDLSIDRWRDCTNPKCGGRNCLEPRILFGEKENPYSFVTVCPFCFTVFQDQPLTDYWAFLWVTKYSTDLSRWGELGEELDRIIQHTHNNRRSDWKWDR